MIFNDEKLRFYGIIKPYPTIEETVSMAKAALDGGITCLQLRYKVNEHLIEAPIEDYALALCSLCRVYQVPFIINDDVSLAYKVNADGVHMGQEDMNLHEARKILGKGRIIGISVHSKEEAIQALKDGADYLGAGAIFPTNSKEDANIISRKTFEEICQATRLPVVAIGGISMDNLDLFTKLPLALCKGVAIISALFAVEKGDYREVQRRAAQLNKKLTSVFPKAIALTIAGSDCSGGAGIQADLKAFSAMGVYGESVITALTAQNTTGVFEVMDSDDSIVDSQLSAVLNDIKPDAIKIGMVSSKSIVNIIASHLSGTNIPIIVDPVMVSTSGHRLICDEAIDTLKSTLFPIASLLTPNIPEAEVLADMTIKDRNDMNKAAEIIFNKFGCPVLCKGGHLVSDACDLLFDGNKFTWFKGRRIDTENTHGTGCTLSSAIAACIAKSMSLEASIFTAKNFISNSMDTGLNLGKGFGPLDHNYMTNKGSWLI